MRGTGEHIDTDGYLVSDDPALGKKSRCLGDKRKGGGKNV